MFARLAVILLLVSSVFAKAPTWAYFHEYELSKDQAASFYLRYKNTNSSWIEYKLSWTHYDGNDLILFAWYKDFVKQYVLKLERRLDFVKTQALADLAIARSDRAEIFLKFVSFKQAKAKIQVFISDPNSRLEADFLKEHNGQN